jgi:hypothetical protein
MTHGIFVDVENNRVKQLSRKWWDIFGVENIRCLYCDDCMIGGSMGYDYHLNRWYCVNCAYLRKLPLMIYTDNMYPPPLIGDDVNISEMLDCILFDIYAVDQEYSRDNLK